MKELQKDPSGIISRVEKVEDVIINKRGKPAVIYPLSEDEIEDYMIQRSPSIRKKLKKGWRILEKDLSDLTEQEIEQILSSCLRLETNPHPDGKHIRKLKGYKDLYRLRIGDIDGKKSLVIKRSNEVLNKKGGD